MHSTDGPLLNFVVSMMGTWACTCGHGSARHCLDCGVCHVGQRGQQDPFKEWCGCLKSVPIWVRLAMR